MVKCFDSTAKILSGFDYWCYECNYLYEFISEKQAYAG